MLNKIYKTINNKYFRLFEFIFFLRYLLIIFLISIVLFLTIPIFFNYEKKAEIIKIHLYENYDFKIKNYKKIKYNLFPLPNLEVSDAKISVKSSLENLNVKKLKIYLNFLNIYNYENFNSNKIFLKDSNIKFQIKDFFDQIQRLLYKKNKLYFDDLNIDIKEGKNHVIKLDNMKFANYGYNENLLTGKIFEKNFAVDLDDNYKKLNFKLINSGINVEIKFDENQKENLKLGKFKAKILNTNFKSDFELDNKILKIKNSYFRSKSFSIKSDSEIIFKPFLDINSKFVIEEFNTKVLRKVDLIEFLKFKKLIKKINYKSEIIFKLKRFNQKIFDDLNLEINLAYGRMNYIKKISIENNILECNGSINFLEESPLLLFDCYFDVKSKKAFLKKFFIKSKNKNDRLELKVKGNLSILNKKINFKDIKMNDNYEASKEDLKYFNDTFEKIFLNKNILNIFDVKRIQKFITEIS